MLGEVFVHYPRVHAGLPLFEYERVDLVTVRKRYQCVARTLIEVLRPLAEVCDDVARRLEWSAPLRRDVQRWMSFGVVDHLTIRVGDVLQIEDDFLICTPRGWRWVEGDNGA